MKNTMYLTKAEADAKGLPSVQEQIDRYNKAVRIAVYHPDCPACLRGRPHSQAEHEEKLWHVYEGSRA
jgi:hypothetical protein